MDQDLSDQSDEIIGLYKRHVPDYVNALGGAVDSEDLEEISFQAHKLCSAMKSVGKTAIAELLEEMQHPDISLTDCRNLFSQVQNRVNESLANLSDS